MIDNHEFHKCSLCHIVVHIFFSYVVVVSIGVKSNHVYFFLSFLLLLYDQHQLFFPPMLWLYPSFNIAERLVQAIQALYENAISAVLLNSKLGEFFQTTVGVCQGCIPSPVVFNLFLERITQETLHDYHTSISIGGKPIFSLQFANNIDLMGGSSDELQGLTNRHIDRATAYGMEVSTEKSKIMTNSLNNISADISINGIKLEEVTSFQHLGAAPVQGWHLLSRNLHLDSLSIGISG